jgi:hypothetical protein
MVVKKASIILGIVILVVTGVFANNNQWQLGVGFKEIDDAYYGSLSFRPDISIGKLGLGLSLTLNFNEDGIRLEDWQEDGKFDLGKTTARIVRYASWGSLRDPIYIRVGELNYVVVANGLIMDGYRNLTSEEIKADIRRLGVEVGVDAGYLGAHVMVNNALKPEVYAVYPYLRPLYGLEKLPSFIKNTSVGLIYVQDSRPEYLMSHAYGVDVTVPLLNFLSLYGQAAELANEARGYSLGAKAHMGPLVLRGEYRDFGENFKPSVYDWQYEDLGTELVFLDEKTSGIMAEAGISLLRDSLAFKLKYENMIRPNRETIPTLTGTAIIGPEFFTAIIGRKGQVEATYTQTNYVVLNDLTNSRTKVDAKISLEMYRGLFGSYVYNITYKPDGTPVRFQGFEISLGGAFN